MGDMETIKIANKGMLATLPEMAAMVRQAFPELENRAIPVSAENVRDEQDLSLPACLLSLHSALPSPQAVLGTGADLSLQDDYVLHFLFPAEREVRTEANGTEVELPLWRYYDYVMIRHRLFKAIHEFAGVNKIMVRFISLEVESDDLAVVLTFRFRQEFSWCDDDDCDTHEPVNIKLTLTGC